MDIKTIKQNGIDIVSFTGSLDTNTSQQAEILLQKLIDGGSKKIVIDLEGIDYISSAGLRILLMVSKRLKKIEGKLRICALNETVREVFDISGFSMIFDLFESKDQALEDFNI
jgi:anti-anti-sigma factor